MTDDENIRVIFDTNVWISFLIGKKLSNLKDYILRRSITIIFTEQLLDEIRIVTQREKLKKYFRKNSVKELLTLLEIIGENVEIKPTYFISRDPKDNFLLDLIVFSKADFLITGDKDLLGHNPFESAQIIKPTEFEDYLSKRNPQR